MRLLISLPTLLFITLLCTCGPAHMHAQLVNGTITDPQGVPVVGATVTATLPDSTDLLAYDITNAKGEYRLDLKLETTPRRVSLQVRLLGYKNLDQEIGLTGEPVNITLKEQAIELQNVVIKAPPISKRGDTLDYYVQSFATTRDRSIADVLRRMPGIDVLSDGKVLYQGKPISKYYIEGMDLLEGKYNLANQNLPFNRVARVQVLENHQPIRLLDSLSSPDEAALNIKLKAGVSFTGEATVGAGLAPGLWNTKLTPMLFNKRQQMISSYQTNNTGEDVSGQLRKLTLEELIDGSVKDNIPSPWLSVLPVAAADLPAQRWHFNKVHLLTTNHLLRLKKDEELRFNVSYLNNRIDQESSVQTTFFTPLGNVQLLENRQNALGQNQLKGGLTFQRNSRRRFLKNALVVERDQQDDFGGLNRNGALINQYSNMDGTRLSNDLKTIFPIGNQLLTLNSFTSFTDQPQALRIDPGPFEEVLAEGVAYDSAVQELNNQQLRSINAVSLTKAIGRVTLKPEAGYVLERASLSSRLTTGGPEAWGQINDTRRTTSKLFLNPRLEYQHKKWWAELSTPLNQRAISSVDNRAGERTTDDFLTLEPRLRLRYDVDAKWRISASARQHNTFGGIEQWFPAFILHDYRQLRRFATELPTATRQNASIGFSYRNPVKSLFASLAVLEGRSISNLLYANGIGADGAQTVLAILEENEARNRSVNGRFSRYFTGVETNVSINLGLAERTGEQLINEEISDVRTWSRSLQLKTNTDFSERLALEQQLSWVVSGNEVAGRRGRNISQLTYTPALTYQPALNHLMTFRMTAVRNSLNNEVSSTVLSDLVYRFSLGKSGVDIEAGAYNIFDAQNYRTLSVDAFRYVQSDTRLRGRQFMASVRFAL
ncbi:MAG: TonB-dependent receptor [Lewinella sp.]